MYRSPHIFYNNCFLITLDITQFWSKTKPQIKTKQTSNPRQIGIWVDSLMKLCQLIMESSVETLHIKPTQKRSAFGTILFVWIFPSSSIDFVMMKKTLTNAPTESTAMHVIVAWIISIVSPI